MEEKAHPSIGWGDTWGSTKVSQEIEWGCGGGDKWARAFIVGSIGSNGQGRVNRLQVG